ncbi:MAG: hypothetical protein CVV37_08030 [Nitrospira bacterium HGW-Nitrospira-1]|nr:MAG: hypothetical protein CVV37_08030 [Nitrospira bacterium HGW-Nitrospira-1]
MSYKVCDEECIKNPNPAYDKLAVLGAAIMYSKTAFLVVIIFSLALFSCAKKEALRNAAIEPYEGPVTVEILKQSVGFGNVRSIKAIADVTISKEGETHGRLNGIFAYKAPGMMRVNLFGPFGLTVTEILISGELFQFSVPPKHVLYEMNSPEVNFSGLMNGCFRYEMAEEGEMYVLLAYNTDKQNPEVTARYYFDRGYLLNRTIRFYKDGSEVIKADFNDFNGRAPERTRLTFSNRMVIDIALHEPEFDADIPDEYFSAIEHGDKQIKSFQEAFSCL